MRCYIARNIFRSIIYNRKDVIYQVVIVAILTAVISGSLLTGESVRDSLRQTSAEKLGNTHFVISSGLRFFNASLDSSLSLHTGDRAVSILELDGYSQNFSTGKTVLNAKILGVNEDFFVFSNGAPVFIERGYAALNERAAVMLGVAPGDDIIVRFSQVDPIPANAPFSPGNLEHDSRVLKVGVILKPGESADFSLSVSQTTPVNIFINIDDIVHGEEVQTPANRILVDPSEKREVSYYRTVLGEILNVNDIGFTLRRSFVSGEPELVSSRIFIDSVLVDAILSSVNGSYPVLTYLANSFTFGDRVTPYSFVSSFDGPLTRDLADNGVIISRWMADDLGLKEGDEVDMTWFVQGFAGKLEETGNKFFVAGIAEWGNESLDPSLMPDFPGISGRSTCSDWDAGIPVLLDRIREKDEEYWNQYGGTPKAFLNYRTGKKLWSNNFGSATAIRFPRNLDTGDIMAILDGVIDPGEAGITVNDVKTSSLKAAEGGTDFGSLFLSLGFFIIVSNLILLSLAVKLFFDSRKTQVTTFFSLGFRKRDIRRMLFTEELFITVSGALPGAFAGYVINVVMINALNGVWRGAVHTDALSHTFSFLPLITGFIAAVLVSLVLIFFLTGRFISSLSQTTTGELKLHSFRRNNVFLVLSLVLSSGMLMISFFSTRSATISAFASGAFFFMLMLLILRAYYIRGRYRSIHTLSKRYYFFNPGEALTPVMIIAAGIFAVMITAANKQFPDERLLPSGGTGGYLLWGETALPVGYDLNSTDGRIEFGLDDEELSDLVFIQAGRVSGDDASCLNLNLVSTPPILGIDPQKFIERESFSFVSKLNGIPVENPWEIQGKDPADNVVYGVADETVLKWGLKIGTGDTIIVSAEDGSPLYIVIAGGLRSSVFQGHVLIHEDDLFRYFPSVAGNSVFLIDGDRMKADLYIETLSDRFKGYGMQVTRTTDRLESFLEVTNTYLNVFMILGVFGMVLGAAGLGFVLLRSYNRRKREFALMAATGFSRTAVRNYIMKDQVLIVIWGIITGTLSGLIATMPSLMSGTYVNWRIIVLMALLIAVTGISAISLSLRSIKKESLIRQLRNE
ncbi:MAG TPA: ABC transporter permease [Bacteroidales bacterium]|nr:ABC transporter permease [Bacteroidales bacterium]HPF03559.1 ABC transporter permease [Bacteroidales bacterium]HPJ60470.1 ABC transporter permease [Bacteroidales bacterium]HPR11177.1 ABC transporter permease [Bacteroidales bacterium]HRW86213.1 ABC transporter permease [Bacteroidales bacterium]